jgi:uncharacterized protein (TIGR00290 family)
MSRPAAWLSWSSGKDSAYSLAMLRERAEVDVTGLVTTINAAADRVAMHAVRRELLQQQADAVGLPLRTVELPWPCPNERYEALMSELAGSAVAQGVSVMAFGDLFLADIRGYRERQLQGSGLEPVFPLWGRDTTELAAQMVRSGLRATISCVDSAQLDPAFAGREFDDELLRELPDGVDHCGENGEFHTFAWDGPGFRAPVGIRVGETTEQGGFVVTDLLPAPSGSVLRDRGRDGPADPPDTSTD